MHRRRGRTHARRAGTGAARRPVNSKKAAPKDRLLSSRDNARGNRERALRMLHALSDRYDCYRGDTLLPRASRAARPPGPPAA